MRCTSPPFYPSSKDNAIMTLSLMWSASDGDVRGCSRGNINALPPLKCPVKAINEKFTTIPTVLEHTADTSIAISIDLVAHILDSLHDSP